ncbi:hypothetical protein KA078_00830 [Candidatus Woesebacteria bacterium]|nr:hypothetical protein [Candidatus Woesebacteria bacterium]
MIPENTLVIEIIHPKEKQQMSDAVCRALWELISAPNFYTDGLTPQWYALLEADFLDQSHITITPDNLVDAIAHGAALSAPESEASTPELPPIEFEI